jgi:hypothetical protein
MWSVKRHGCCDVSVSVENSEVRFAGRVETGATSITDPEIGGVGKKTWFQVFFGRIALSGYRFRVAGRRPKVVLTDTMCISDTLCCAKSGSLV